MRNGTREVGIKGARMGSIVGLKPSIAGEVCRDGYLGKEAPADRTM